MPYAFESNRTVLNSWKFDYYLVRCALVLEIGATPIN